MMIETSILFFLVFSVIVSISAKVEAHGYLKSPRARNFVAYQDGVWSSEDSSNLYYRKEDCPHCANRGGSLARCGLIGNRNYDLPMSITNELMPANPQATFERGSVITVDIVLTAHHKGHFVFKACPIQHGEVPTQDCFDQYPLEFVSDQLYGAPKDEQYVTRAYIAPGANIYRFNMKLPDSLSGDLVLLQWHYLTANTCSFVGYSEYNAPNEWGSNSIAGSVGLCDLPLPQDGNGAPEQFWNCAEISILDGPVSPTMMTPLPPPSAGSVPTTPYMDPYPSPPTPAVSNTPNIPCGNGEVGNGRCAGSNECCSEWGWCGTSPSHCRANLPTNLNPIPQAPPMPTIVSATPVSFCFSGQSTVRVKDSRGEIQMKHLQLGDEVQVEEGKYERVYSFGHREENTSHDFLRLLPYGLELTPDHMVFLEDGKTAVPASNVQVGDRLLLLNNKLPEEVRGIEKVRRHSGVYAPFTYSGKLIVNDVTASSYIAFQNSNSLTLSLNSGSNTTTKVTTPFSWFWIAHSFTFPRRFWCSISECKTEEYTTAGVSKWVDAPYRFTVWLLDQHPLILFLVSLPLVFVLLLLSILDSLVFTQQQNYLGIALITIITAICVVRRYIRIRRV